MIIIVSFGYHWRPGVQGAHLTVDVRRRLRDPNVDPEFRKLTGLHDAVRDKVLSTPGATDLVAALTATVAAMRVRGEDTVLAIGCVGGKHRSVALTVETWRLLSNLGEEVRVEHLDIGSPVVQPAV